MHTAKRRLVHLIASRSYHSQDSAKRTIACSSLRRAHAQHPAGLPHRARWWLLRQTKLTACVLERRRRAITQAIASGSALNSLCRRPCSASTYSREATDLLPCRSSRLPPPPIRWLLYKWKSAHLRKAEARVAARARNCAHFSEVSRANCIRAFRGPGPFEAAGLSSMTFSSRVMHGRSVE
eukprot:4782685-Amphidinium_carterae.1